MGVSSACRPAPFPPDAPAFGAFDMFGTNPDARGASDARLPDPASLFSSKHGRWRIAVRMTSMVPHRRHCAQTHRPIDGHGKIRDSARPAGDNRFWKRKPGTVRRSPTKRGSIPGLVTLRQRGDVCGTQTSRLPGPGRPAEHRHTCRRAGFEEIKVRTDSRRLGLS